MNPSSLDPCPWCAVVQIQGVELPKERLRQTPSDERLKSDSFSFLRCIRDLDLHHVDSEREMTSFVLNTSRAVWT